MKLIKTPLVVVAISIAVASSSVMAEAPAGRYAIATDSVKDKKTGLTWQRAVPYTKYNWEDANSYCKTLSLGGFSSGWRLPTAAELETLVDRRVEFPPGPTIDSAAFPDTPLSAFWTSTPAAGVSNNVWNVDFNHGTSYYEDASRYASRVRCVR